MYQPSQGHVTNEHVGADVLICPVERKLDRAFDGRVGLCSSGQPGAAVPMWFAAPLHERDVRAYIARRLWPRADRCAPVSISRPVRNAQNIRLTDSAKGP
jgi:hypothetical protein